MLTMPAPASMETSSGSTAPDGAPVSRAQIVFVCPSVNKIMGGIKYVFRMAEALRRAGYDAIACEGASAKPRWFATEVPVFGRDRIGQRRDQVLVLGEDVPVSLHNNAKRHQRKVIYCQNHFYAAQTAPDGGSWADFGV